MSWTSYQPLKYGGKQYGQKDLELARFIHLPSAVKPTALEVAVSGTNHASWELGSGTPQDTASKCTLTPEQLLEEAGWQIVDPNKVCSDFDSYRNYIETSKAECSVAKNGYVQGQSGWFSCRSACYLAAGRPVVVQNTGFPKVIPTGEGVFAFNTLEEAQIAIREVEQNYQFHRKAAREIAEQYFDSDRVLARFVDEAMSASTSGDEHAVVPMAALAEKRKVVDIVCHARPEEMR
jgi:hypothetical protein